MTRVLTAATVLLASTFARNAPAGTPVEHIVTRAGDKLMDGDEELRFISFNIPNLHYVEDHLPFAETNPWRLPDEFEIEDALEAVRQQGGTVVRYYTLSVRKADDGEDIPRHVLGPGEFDENAFRALDKVLEIANQKGIRVIVPFVDQWSWWGGIAEYAAFRGKPQESFFTDPEIIADYERTVAHVIGRTNTYTGARYADDPTILCWETGNELKAPDSWTRKVTAYIKSLDDKHLVLDGYNTNQLRQETLEHPDVDMVTTHHYENDPVQMVEHIRQSARLARGHKPYFVGEFGFISTLAVREVCDVVIEEGAAGALVWSLRYRTREGGFYWHSEPSGGDHFKAYHWPGFPSGNVYDETGVLKVLQERAFQIRGLAVPAVAAPAAPTLLDIADVAAISWQGSAGALAYDVERSTSDAGPWDLVGENVSDAAVTYRPLFADSSAEPGTGYYYRVTAHNSGGRSAASNIVGPVTPTDRAIIDEWRDWSKVFAVSGGLRLRTANARKAKEDFNRVAGRPGAFLVYKTDADIATFRTYVFFPKEVVNFTFSTSSNGVDYTAVPIVREDALAQGSGQAETYGYWHPIAFRPESVPPEALYLKVEFGAEAEISRVEIRYDAQAGSARRPNPG
jgi:hypothetical protein